MLTLRNLSCQWRRDGDKVQVFATIVDWHLSALPEVITISIALCHEHVQGEPTVHEHTYKKRRKQNDVCAFT